VAVVWLPRLEFYAAAFLSIAFGGVFLNLGWLAKTRPPDIGFLCLAGCSGSGRLQLPNGRFGGCFLESVVVGQNVASGYWISRFGGLLWEWSFAVAKWYVW
jgi:hypothetical protein